MKKRILTFVTAVSLLSAICAAQPIDHTPWADVLQTFVNDEGRVDYEALKKDRAALEKFIAQVEQADVESMSPIEQKAFWLNAYNALTLNVVADAYPVKSIRHINFGLVWQVGRKAAGRTISLGDIEHKILRPLGDPRIHFALNCASLGCPRLPREPFDPKILDEQLEKAAADFINDPQKVRLDRETGTLYYSAIFDWFEEDFLKAAPDIVSYIKRYINEDDRQYLETHSVKTEVLSYDWGLNGQ